MRELLIGLAAWLALSTGAGMIVARWFKATHRLARMETRREKLQREQRIRYLESWPMLPDLERAWLLTHHWRES